MLLLIPRPYWSHARWGVDAFNSRLRTKHVVSHERAARVGAAPVAPELAGRGWVSACCDLLN